MKLSEGKTGFHQKLQYYTEDIFVTTILSSVNIQFTKDDLQRKVLKRHAIPSIFYGGKNNAEKENDPICDDNTVICDSALPVFTNHNNINQDIINQFRLKHGN